MSAARDMLHCFVSHTTSDHRDFSLAHKIAAELQARGVEVWIAPESIPAGDRWEAHIVSGVMDRCSHFLVILSAAAVKSKWVMKEVALARTRESADAAFRVLPLFVGDLKRYPDREYIETLQRVPYHDDFHAQIDAIARALGLRPPVPQEMLTFMEERLRDFVGREYVFDAIDRFLTANPNGYFVLEADPGAGKSAIMAEFVRRTGAIAHFNMRSLGVNTTRHFVEGVCAQIVARFGLPYTSIPAAAALDGSFLLRVLTEAAQRLDKGERLIVAVDALDEVDLSGTPDGANILFLPAAPPAGVYFVMSRRQVQLPFAVRVPQTVYDLGTQKDGSRRDIDAYIRRAAERPALAPWLARQPAKPEAVITALADKSENNFMYVRYVLLELEKGDAALDIDTLPVGLEGYYEDHWRRMGMTAKPLPRVNLRIIYILCEIRRPVSRKLLAQFASDAALKVDELTVQETLDLWDQFLHELRTPDGVRYSLYHASFRDFLHRKDIIQAAGISLGDVNALIADDLWGGLFPDEPA